MKKFSKILLSSILVVALLVSSAAFVIPSNAQVITKLIASFEGLSAATADYKEDYIKVGSSGTITDKLQVKLANADSEKNIRLVSITSNYNNKVTFTMPENVVAISNIVLVPGEEVTLGVKGTVTNGGILTVTVTYQVDGYPETSRETVNISKYCALQDAWSENEQFVFINGVVFTSHMWSGTTYMKFYPFTSANAATFPKNTSYQYAVPDKDGSYSQYGVTYKLDGEEQNDTDRAKNVAYITGHLWVDASKYPDFSDMGAYIGHENKVNKDYTHREYTIMEQIHAELKNLENNSIATLSVGDINLDKDTKSDWCFYNLSSDKDNGYAVQTASLKGKIGNEAAYTLNISMLGRSTEAVVTIPYFNFPVGSKQSEVLGADYTITIHNNNKGALRSRIASYESQALNEKSYTATSWAKYKSALETAYKVLGANVSYKNGSTNVNVTKTVVADALSALETAYAGLKRNVTVVTNHFLTDKQIEIGADGTVSTKIVTISRIGDNADYDLIAVDGTNYTLNVLPDKLAGDPKYNHKDVQRSITLDGASSNYYTEVNQYYWYVDDTALQAKVDKYNHLMNLDKEDYELDGENIQKIVDWDLRGDTQIVNNIPVDRKGNQIFTTDSWENYQAALESAKQLLADTSNCYQYDVDVAVNAVTKAETDLTTEDITSPEYIDGRAWVECIMYDGYYTDPGYGWAKDDLFQGGALDAYEALEDINGQIDAAESGDPFIFTEADAEDWAKTLWDAVADLYIVDETTKGTKVEFGGHFADVSQYGYYNTISDQDCDEYGLKDLFLDIIDDPNAEYDRIKLDETEYTEDSWAKLQDALYGNYEPALGGVAETQEFYDVNDDIGTLNVPAYSMINNIWFLASQADYNACFDYLMSCVNNLEYINDITSLEEAMGTVTDAAPEEGAYTQVSFNNYLAVYEDASAVFEALQEPQTYGMGDDAIRQATIDAKASALLNAYYALDLIPAMEIKDTSLDLDEGGNIEGVSSGATVSSILNKLGIDKEDVEDGDYKGEYRIETSNGVALDNTEAVGTGYKLILSYNGVDYESHDIIVTGDINGDAAMTNVDYRTIYNFSFFHTGIESDSIYYTAADINGDGRVNLCDAALLKRSITN